MLLALIVAVAALIMPTAPARADIQTVYYNGTFGATGTQQWFALSGQSQCALTLSGSGTGMSITVQGASDQPPATPTTLTAIGTAGVVTTNGTYSGAVAGSALTGIRLNVTAITGGALNFNTIIGSQSVASSAVDSFEIVIGQGITGIGSNSVKICSGSAPCFTSGTGAPAGTAPNGSIYMRYDGTTGTRMYVWQCTASTSCATPVAVAGF